MGQHVSMAGQRQHAGRSSRAIAVSACKHTRDGADERHILVLYRHNRPFWVNTKVSDIMNPSTSLLAGAYVCLFPGQSSAFGMGGS